MTLVDTSAWIEFLRGTGSPANRRLRELITEEGQLLTTGPIEMELVAGARDERELVRVRRALASCRNVAIEGGRDWEDAATVYATCQRAGYTPGELIDCLIAAVAIRTESPVLTQDRDFHLIAEHTPLELAR